MNSHYIHSEPNQFNNDFHISLIRHDNKLSDIMCQLNTNVLSVLLCLADTLYYFIVNVPPVCLFERNFQRNRRGMQLDVRGRVVRRNPTTTIFLIFQNFIDLYPSTISQIFPFFYSHPSPTIPKIPILFSQPIFLKFKNFLRNENYSLQK